MNKFEDIPFKNKDYPWNEKQVIALAHSIEHWYNNWNDLKFANIGSGSCQCCTDFLYTPENLMCNDCPIKLHSGYINCKYTPWSNCKIAADECAGYSNKKKDAYEKEYKFLVEIFLGERKPSINKENE